MANNYGEYTEGQLNDVRGGSPVPNTTIPEAQDDELDFDALSKVVAYGNNDAAYEQTMQNRDLFRQETVDSYLQDMENDQKARRGR